VSKVKPILFSGPMVRALIEGRKTQTRRGLKAEVPPCPGDDNWLRKRISGEIVESPRHPSAYLDAYCSERATAANPRGMSRNWCWWTRDDRQCLPTFPVPYAPGDVLWVRETWAPWQNGEGAGGIDYAATPSCNLIDRGWKPSIHMPRLASRLTLAVTGVKVEKLQHITDDDAKAEGATGKPCPDIWRRGAIGWSMNWPDVEPEQGWGYVCLNSPRLAFGSLWNDINGEDAWNANPWVVAVTFAVHHQNVDAYLAQQKQVAA
jgi:hypothetical protein